MSWCCVINKKKRNNLIKRSTGGLRVECSPATRAIRVRVSASAKLFISFQKIFCFVLLSIAVLLCLFFSLTHFVCVCAYRSVNTFFIMATLLLLLFVLSFWCVFFMVLWVQSFFVFVFGVVVMASLKVHQGSKIKDDKRQMTKDK